MLIELENEFFDFRFISAQIEITGKCNMKCLHCRASIDPGADMTLETFSNLLDFCDFKEGFNFTISGGEPFLHKGIYDFINILINRGVYEVVITTNGSLITQNIIDNLLMLKIPKLTVQVSIDNIVPEKHDAFRGFKGAFASAIKGINLLIHNNIFTSMRVAVTKQTLTQIEPLIKQAISLGIKRIGFTCVVPSGRALDNLEILVSSEEKKQLFENLKEYKKKYPTIEIVTGDPLKFLAGFCNIPSDIKNDSQAFFGGCEAGIARINCDSEGNITPCALLPIKILNVNDGGKEKNQTRYVQSDVIINLFERRLKGKCGKCILNRKCGGCRAIAYGLTGDYLGEDNSCFKKD